MAFCDKCGAQVADGAAFCPSCGAARARASASAGGGGQAVAGTGLQENVAGLLAYVAWWITGIIFLLIDKRPFVRFHAAQSIVLFGAITILGKVIGLVAGGTFLGTGSFIGLGFFGLIASCIWLASLVLWILCMVKAYQGERFKLPFVGDIAESIAGK